MKQSYLLKFQAGNKQTISFRRQRLDIDCMLPASSIQPHASTSSLNANLDDPYLIDMIKLADERITQIQTELDEYKQSKEILENKLSSFKNQVSNFIYSITKNRIGLCVNNNCLFKSKI
jgi:hypothetical protein